MPPTQATGDSWPVSSRLQTSAYAMTCLFKASSVVAGLSGALARARAAARPLASVIEPFRSIRNRATSISSATASAAAVYPEVE